MAKAAFNLPFNHPFSTSLGDHSIYTRKDSKKLVVRSKGGPTKEQVKTDPVFEKLRNHGSEFGGASSAAKMLRDAMLSVKNLGDFNLHSRLTGLIKAIMEIHSDNPGKRPIIFSNAKPLLEGFHLNDTSNFDSVISSPIGFAIDRSAHSAVLQLPPLFRGKNFKSPWPYSFYRFRINLGIIRDMVFVEELGYRPQMEDEQGYTEMLDTEWYESGNNLIGQEVGLRIIDPAFDETCYLLLSIGIEFGTPAYGKIRPVKHAGCAKVLGMR